MEASLDRAPCSYFSFSDDGTLLTVNSTLCDQLGYSKSELIGQKVDVLFTLSTRIFHQTHFFPLLKMQGHAQEIFIILQTKLKGQVPVLLNARRELESGVNACACITVHNRKKFEDELVAARKAAEKALQENTELQEAKSALQAHTERLDESINRLDQQHTELKQFNWVVTHDLQEPLRKMLVFSGMLLEIQKETLPDRTRNILQKLLNVSEQLRSIVSGLQQYVWLNENPNKIAEVNLNSLLLGVQQQLVTEYGDGHLVLESETLPVLQADQSQVELLLYQVLSNAVKFRKPGSKAHVRINGTVLQQNSFRNLPGKYKYEDFLKLRIEDKGIGFEAVYSKQIFNLFKKLHNDSGRGLGLSLSKKVVENHHGTITADSHPGEGTVITILLPLAQVPVKDGIVKETSFNYPTETPWEHL